MRKLRTFAPLIVIFLIIVLASLGVMAFFDAWRMGIFMRFFMGFFFVIFGSLKFYDLQGFVNAYREYDIIAQRSQPYAVAYPFIELALGMSYLVNFSILITLVATFAIMSVSVLGVFIALRNKQQLQCACVGTFFKLPMTTVTLVEDVLMAGMALWTLVMIFI